MLVVALVVAAGIAGAFSGAESQVEAQQSGALEITRVCVNLVTGSIRNAPGSATCGPIERAVELPEGRTAVRLRQPRDRPAVRGVGTERVLEHGTFLGQWGTPTDFDDIIGIAATPGR